MAVHAGDVGDVSVLVHGPGECIVRRSQVGEEGNERIVGGGRHLLVVVARRAGVAPVLVNGEKAVENCLEARVRLLQDLLDLLVHLHHLLLLVVPRRRPRLHERCPLLVDNAEEPPHSVHGVLQLAEAGEEVGVDAGGELGGAGGHVEAVVLVEGGVVEGNAPLDEVLGLVQVRLELLAESGELLGALVEQRSRPAVALLQLLGFDLRSSVLAVDLLHVCPVRPRRRLQLLLPLCQRLPHEQQLLVHLFQRCLVRLPQVEHLDVKPLVLLYLDAQFLGGHFEVELLLLEYGLGAGEPAGAIRLLRAVSEL
mmetsp:Transcript_15366/g.60057  ORF Transcript_15366/g.60057 Transcript_15366/m.60057 type:complete len:310 (+) Transcript_15366:1360-2289(+)